MTIQVAIMNASGLAMASDRHIFRGSDVRSTGQQCKLLRLRGPVPAAMMAAGPLSIGGMPVSRLALRLEAALQGALHHGDPDALAESVTVALNEPLTAGSSPADLDAEVLAGAAELVLAHALDQGRDAASGLHHLLEEVARSPFCRGGADAEEAARHAWATQAPGLADRLEKPELAQAFRDTLLDTVHDTNMLCGRAVVGALTRDWRRVSEHYLTVGFCCPATGVPVLVAVKLWRGVGGRLHSATRLDRDWDAAWTAGRTVIVAQGSGRSMIEAIVDGMADDHWSMLQAAERDLLRPGMKARWGAAHARVSTASLAELSSMATGLVRGAEAAGFLTRDGEGTMAPVDCAVMSPAGYATSLLPS